MTSQLGFLYQPDLLKMLKYHWVYGLDHEIALWLQRLVMQTSRGVFGNIAPTAIVGHQQGSPYTHT